LEVKGDDKLNTIFITHFDTREKEQVISKDKSHVFKSGGNFTAIATTIDGYIITGDQFGIVKVYNDISKNAVIKFDQFGGVSFNKEKYPKGEPIVGIDISKDKTWIVWCTPSYACIVQMKDENYEKQPKEKPRCMMMKISENDIEKYGIKKIDFLPVKFDVGPCRDLTKKDIIEKLCLYIY